jgi:NAD(P) transhydrogenase subunit alpha
MRLAVLRERHPGEKRVGLSPAHVASLIKAGWEVRVESLAGDASGWDDNAYRAVGARVEATRAAALEGASCVVKVRPPSTGAQGQDDEVGALPSGVVLVSFLSPGGDDGLPQKLAARGVSAMAMERIPRTTRAQRMDALSSQATTAGYRAVLLAALHLPRFLPMLTTAAGTVKPARVLVLGAGVAGLQAISTARRLGAVVQGYDIRPAVAEQVRSLGATFLQDDDQPMAAAETAGGYARALETSEKDRQLAFLGRHVPKADAVLTMAQIPGRRAPLLVTASMVEGMAPGSVVVDVAAETGGNCELSVPGQTIVHNGVTIVAPTDLPSGVSQHASQMYGTNVTALLALLVKDGAMVIDTSDDIVASVLVTHEGAVRTQ